MESIDEEEVLQLMFACLYLTFWELAMNPQGTTWQKHVRGLGNILQWRGPQGFHSPRSLQVIILIRLFILLEAVSAKRLTILSEPQWYRFRNLHPSLLPWQPTSNADDKSDPDTQVGPKHYLDFILDRLITISNLTAEFSEGLIRDPSMSSL
jgi:hypothetical protein